MYILVFPKELVDNNNIGTIQKNKADIDWDEICPLVIEKVIFKAKKLKENVKISNAE